MVDGIVLSVKNTFKKILQNSCTWKKLKICCVELSAHPFELLKDHVCGFHTNGSLHTKMQLSPSIDTFWYFLCLDELRTDYVISNTYQRENVFSALFITETYLDHPNIFLSHEVRNWMQIVRSKGITCINYVGICHLAAGFRRCCCTKKVRGL